MPNYCRLPEFLSGGAVHSQKMEQKSVTVGRGIVLENILKLSNVSWTLHRPLEWVYDLEIKLSYTLVRFYVRNFHTHTHYFLCIIMYALHNASSLHHLSLVHPHYSITPSQEAISE